MSDFHTGIDYRGDHTVAGETEGAVHGFDVDVETGNAGSVGKSVLSGVLQVPLLRRERIGEGADREGAVAIHTDVRHVGRPDRARGARQGTGLGRSARLR